jgi:hypothetical protein
VKSVEERTGVDIDCPLKIALVEGRLELQHVDRDNLGIQPKLANALDDAVVANLAADRVDRLAERVPRALFFDVRPERGDYPVAQNSAGAGTRQQGEDGEPPRLRQRAGERFALAVDGEAA